MRGQGRYYIATRGDGGQVSTGSRIDAINASLHVEEHPDTSIEDALTFVIKERVGLDGLKVVGARVEIDAPHAIDATLSPKLRLLDGVEVDVRLPTRWLMSTQEVYGKGQWRHVRAGFEPITVHAQAAAFSAALVAAGKLGAPANDPLVAKLYHETVGVHVATRLAAKDIPPLVHTITTCKKRLDEWSHGKIKLKSETDARKFSKALQDRRLLEAPAGDSLVQSTALKSKFHRRVVAEVQKAFEEIILAPALANKEKEGLIVISQSEYQSSQFNWYLRGGESIHLTSERDAKTFSKALIQNNLVDAPAGDPRVRKLFKETFPDLAKKTFRPLKPKLRAKLAASPRLIAMAKAAAAAAARQSPQNSLTSSGAVVAPRDEPAAAAAARLFAAPPSRATPSRDELARAAPPPSRDEPPPGAAASPRAASPRDEPPPARAEQSQFARVTVTKRRRQIVESDDDDDDAPAQPSPEPRPSKMQRVSPAAREELVQLARGDPDALQALFSDVLREAHSAPAPLVQLMDDTLRVNDIVLATPEAFGAEFARGVAPDRMYRGKIIAAVKAGTWLVHYDDDGLYLPTSEEFLTLCMRS